MAEFNRSLSTPIEARNRSRPHVSSCPRCRVEPPASQSRPWESSSPASTTRAPPNATVADIPPAMAEQSTLPQNGYPPDLCWNRPGATARGATGGHHSQGVMRYTGDAHSTRSAGDTWRIRGILENYQPDPTRRQESGRLPDVTQPSGMMIQHARTRSVPVGGAHDARVPPSGGAEFQHRHHHQQQPVMSRSASHGRHQQASTSQRRDVLPSATATSQQQWKRDNQCPASSPWVTRADSRPPQPSTSSNLTWPNREHHQQQQQPAVTPGSCWRPSATAAPQNVLSQCPLPDLVTPRRQARKQCCGLLATHSVAIRWLVVVVAALGLLCSIVGTIVGVVKASGREHLTVALLLIGLGIVLVSMSGVAWRLTSRESPSCRAMFGLRRTRHEPHRRFVPRVPHYGRPHPFSAMLYPDISLRPPPPSYQASMQEYRLRLLLMDRQVATPPPSHSSPPQQPPPPPPIYRGPTTVYPRFPVGMGISDYSRPPSYRSRPSSAGQPSPIGPEDIEIINTNTTTPSLHLPSDVTMLTLIAPPTPQVHRTTSPSVGGATNNHVEVVAQV